MRDEGVGTRDHVHGREGKGQQMKKKKERTHQVAVASRDEGDATGRGDVWRRGMRHVAKGDATRGKGDTTRGKGRGKGGCNVTRHRGYAWRRRGRVTGRGRHLKRGQCDARRRGGSQGNGREGICILKNVLNVVDGGE
jgi:hypothetical protein